MKELVVKSQAELDAVAADYDGRIIVEFGTDADPAKIVKNYKNPVILRESSSAELRGSSRAVLWENAQSTVCSGACKCETHGSARIVTGPRTIDEYIKYYAIESDGGAVRLFKAVHKRDGRFWADWTTYEYKIGAVAVADCLTLDQREDCGHGIHMAYKAWCVDYGRSWNDLAIIELEADKADIVVPLYGGGKVRASKAKVIREVPLEECGLLGEMLAARRK